MLLCLNPNAIHLLERNQDKIGWTQLSSNPNAIYLLEQNPDKFHGDFLSSNPKAIHLLKQHPEKIYWYYLSTNPSIFEPDYQSMSIDRTKIIYQELMEKALHPSRVLQWMEEDEDFDF
jgi:hypothetical protein